MACLKWRKKKFVNQESAKNFFKDESKINTFPNKQKLREFVDSTPVLREMLKEVLYGSKDSKLNPYKNKECQKR